ncbi:hypothetical protein [Pseudomonas helleri]|uniref:hypothetical protein n=1 Tax=Pseudomonas helleri TaxID=1608996 RepID=UPI0028E6EFB3|nr:hypothetical protein [Pseudomonas helleri]
MSATKSVNGYLIKNVSSKEWWMVAPSGEHIAGPFSSEEAAIEVAEVFEDLAGLAPRGRSKD